MFSQHELINLRMMVGRAAPYQNLEEAQVATQLAAKLEALLADLQKAALAAAVQAELEKHQLAKKE